MTSKRVSRFFAVFIAIMMVSLTISPVLANTDEQLAASPEIQADYSSSGVESSLDQISSAESPEMTSIDPVIVKATPYWVLLAAGNKEKKALFAFIDKTSASRQKKQEWKRGMNALWKKYPVTIEHQKTGRTLTFQNPRQKNHISANEEKILDEISSEVGNSFIESQKSTPVVKWWAGGDDGTHERIIQIALQHELPGISDTLNLAAKNAAAEPDLWYDEHIIPDPTNPKKTALEHFFDHCYMYPPYQGTVPFVPVQMFNAPSLADADARSANNYYKNNDMNNAFTSLGHASHYYADLGQPLHTGAVYMMGHRLAEGLAQQHDISIPYVLDEEFHGAYEKHVKNKWGSLVSGNAKTYEQYALETTSAETIVAPSVSAVNLAKQSGIYANPLSASIFWGHVFGLDMENNPAIGSITRQAIITDMKYQNGLVRYMVKDGIIVPVATEWNWATDGWGDWQHSATWTGGTGTEYLPVMVGNHGEHGADVHLSQGTVTSTVERTFTAPAGTQWNTLTLVGRVPGSDTPAGRWLKIYVNDVLVHSSSGYSSSDPANQYPSTVTATFSPTNNAKVTIMNGQNPAWGVRFFMEYYTLALSSDPTVKAVASGLSETGPQVIKSGPETPVFVSNMTETSGENLPLKVQDR